MATKPPIRILHLEDNLEDATLVRLTLEHAGIASEIHLAGSRAAFELALRDGAFDLILSDYSLPSFDGLAALRVAAHRAPRTPFILVSGTMGEETAIESLHNGATDYVLKDRLSRLGPAVLRALQTAEDQRNRKAAEDALAHEQHFLVGMLDSIETGIVACDADGKITLFNRAAKVMHSLPADVDLASVPGDYFQLFEADGLTRVGFESLPLFRILRGETVRGLEIVVASKSQAPRRTLVAGTLILDGLGRRLGAVVALHDVTAQRKLEDQLRQSQKMEAIGRLAGGVAHDFNNLLTVIMAYGHLIKSECREGDARRQGAEEILKASERAATLTRQLLAFSRQQVLQPKVLDLGVILTDLDKMLRRLIGEDIQFTTASSPGLGAIKADPGQIEQVILNLVVNARDAMPDGGQLTIETANVDLDESYVGSRVDLRPGQYVMVAVTDTGCGMSPDVMARIYEPFFTTKEHGKGTGLGLATVLGIVKQSEGHIEAYSEVGVGTTFKVYFPRVDAVAAAPVSATEVRGSGGTETVLLVEDEEMIRRVVRTTLEGRGYSVIEAGDGSQAIATCERADQRIDLLITDVVMPLMSGAELARRAALVRPSLRVLFMSGYTDRALMNQGLRQPGTAFLQKPFTPDTLSRKVRELLDEGLSKAA